MADYLKCDALGCDHLEIVGEINAALIGKPCPKCGASLLSAEDCAFYINNIKPTKDLMKALGLVTEYDGGEVPEGQSIMQVGHHAGETTIKIKE